MVNITVAGGTGNVATEILRATIASGRHNITILTRHEPPTFPTSPVHYRLVDYTDEDSLVEALKCSDVCLSFMVVHIEEGFKAQLTLVRACIKAGVKRFAPSEWGIKSFSPIPEYKNKDSTVKFLQEINKNEQVLEYTLFQPSIFLDYFAYPHSLSPNLYTWPFFVDLSTRHAIIPGTGNYSFVLTAIADDSDILLRAIEDPNPWPTTGGIRGSRLTLNELLAIAKKIRGGNWTVEYVEEGDIEKGELKTDWCPTMNHPVIPKEMRDSYSRPFVANFLNALVKGAWDVSDDFNQRYPDHHFMGIEQYLEKAWQGKN